MRLISNFKRTHNPYTCIEEVELEEEQNRFNHLMQTHGKLVSAFRNNFTFTLLLFHFYFCKYANCVIRAQKKSVSRFFLLEVKENRSIFISKSIHVFCRHFCAIRFRYPIDCGVFFLLSNTKYIFNKKATNDRSQLIKLSFLN